MITVILIELAIAVLAGLAFAVIYFSGPWYRSAAGRHMMAVALVMAAEAATLFALGLGAPIPMWAFALGYALMDAVVIHRLVLMWKLRKSQP